MKSLPRGGAAVLGGLVLFSVMAWFTRTSPQVPYNIRELFAGDYPSLTVPLFASFLYWAFGVPVWLALWLTRGRWLRAGAYPLLVAIHGLGAWSLLRLSVPLESIYDLVGSPILTWPWEWELVARFVSLFGAVSILMAGAAVSMIALRSADPGGRYVVLLRWAIPAAFLLPLTHWIVVSNAATDNLTELMSAGGSWPASIYLAVSLLIVASTASFVSADAATAFRHGFLTGVVVPISVPLAYVFLQLGTERAIYKYGKVFSTLQFLLSPDRDHYVEGLALILRYALVHSTVIAIIAVAQYPFWVWSTHTSFPPRRAS